MGIGKSYRILVLFPHNNKAFSLFSLFSHLFNIYFEDRSRHTLIGQGDTICMARIFIDIGPEKLREALFFHFADNLFGNRMRYLFFP